MSAAAVPGQRQRRGRQPHQMPSLDLVEFAAEHDAPLVNHGDVVRDALQLVEQVRGEQGGPAFLGDSLDDCAEDVAAHDRVKSGRLATYAGAWARLSVSPARAAAGPACRAAAGP